MQSGPATNPDPASMTPGMILAGRYRLERSIGAGGFGTVFAAVNANTGERVALKVLSPRILDMAGGAERFRREAELARRLDHPNVVRVLDAGSDPSGALFIAFELLEGRSLQDEIAQRGAIAPRRAVAICHQVLAALEHAHHHGIVHRDLKPANVFLMGGVQEGVVKVLDFGIAKSTNPGTRAGLTQDGTAIGTPAYMAPEQLSGGDIGPATDIFAAGVVLAEMLSGRPMFDQSCSPIQIITMRLSRGLPIADDVLRSPLGHAISGATAIDPSQRFASAAQMRAAIDGVAHQLSQGTFETTVKSAGTVTGGAPTVAPVAVTMGSPLAGAPSPAWYPAPAPAPLTPGPKRSSSATPLLIILVALGFSLAAVGGYWLTAKRGDKRAARAAADDDDDDTPRKKKKRREESDDTEETAAAPDRPPERRPDPPVTPPDPDPDPDPDPTPAVLGRARACAGGPVAPAGLRGELGKAGFSVTGTLLYCAGDMVNFQCLGPKGDGFTVDGGGSAALFRMKSPAEAEAFAKREAQAAKDEVTYVWDAGRVIRIEMKASEADRLVKSMCRG